jgi:acetyl-CoA carboxylase biotin carboxyl carrier protein
MNFDEIKQILDMMREHELSEFELERDDFKLRLRKNSAGTWNGASAVPNGQFTAPVAPPTAPAASAGQEPAPVLASADEALDLAVLKSPIVGTFYRASEPGAKPFAEVGDSVRKGQVLCIIEAMKLMNEINAECDGEVVKVYVENGQAVQYGERLFALKPA